MSKRQRQTEVTQQSDDGGMRWLHATLSTNERQNYDEWFKKHLFLCVPQDFYDLYDLAAFLSPTNPLDAFVDACGLRLAGPFAFLANKTNSETTTTPLFLQGRYYVDPPEVATVLIDTKSTTGGHYAYFRDAPNQTPTYVVHAADSSKCSFELVASTLFEVVGSKCTPSDKLQSYLHPYTTQYPIRFDRNQRKKQQVAPSLSGLGILVPYDAKKQSGYRELPVTGDELRDLLENAASGIMDAKKKLSGLITRATIANDECDFGTSLLLGLDVWTTGAGLQREALQLLRVAYMLLRRSEFYKIAHAHVSHRGPCPTTEPVV